VTRKERMILVTGATGNVGRQAAAQLLQGGTRVRALTRNAESRGLCRSVST
jgi:uncharacterized protein YbjT (DUF2867 family)